jgi:hypothetical protein
MKIAITGSPKAGKSTLAKALASILGYPLKSTDEVSDLEWSQASEEVSRWFDWPGDFIIEGVTVPRALRKWSIRNPGKPPPLDRFIIIPEAKVLLTEQGQVTMKKQVVGLSDTLRAWLGERWLQV